MVSEQAGTEQGTKKLDGDARAISRSGRKFTRQRVGQRSGESDDGEQEGSRRRTREEVQG